MRGKFLYYTFILAILSSCQSDLEKGLKNGTHKAFVECYNTETGEEEDIVARVEVKNGVVKKIIPASGNRIDKFDFWETKDSDSQDVYGAGDVMYSVHLILED
jgi:hypothetical protein